MVFGSPLLILQKSGRDWSSRTCGEQHSLTHKNQCKWIQLFDSSYLSPWFKIPQTCRTESTSPQVPLYSFWKTERTAPWKSCTSYGILAEPSSLGSSQLVNLPFLCSLTYGSPSLDLAAGWVHCPRTCPSSTNHILDVSLSACTTGLILSSPSDTFLPLKSNFAQPCLT